MSRRLIVTLDDDLSEVLTKYPNQAEEVRKALRIYLYDITTDTIQGMRKLMKIIISQQEEIKEQLLKLNSKVPEF